MLLKQSSIIDRLLKLDRTDLTPYEIKLLHEELEREVIAIWETDELRRTKPTPQDEARSGLYVVERQLWEAVPSFMRKLDADAEQVLGKKLPVDVCPVKFGSWMGGDRDGNPNVTAEVTAEVGE